MLCFTRPVHTLTLALILGLLANTLIAAEAPIGIRAEVQALGKGASGTVMGIVVQVAPEDRGRIGERSRVTLTLRDPERAVVDRQSTIVQFDEDGTTLIYQEWSLGSFQLEIVVEPLDVVTTGVWIGEIKVPESKIPFTAPEGATADAIALEITPPRQGAVKIIPPADLGGIGGLQLQVEVPEATASIEFFHDGRPIMQRNRPPWTVSIPLDEVIQRTVVKAVARDARGHLLGEDAIVLNNPTGQLGVEVLLAEGTSATGTRTVTVAVSGYKRLQQVTLSLDDRLVARWTDCPCITEISTHELETATIMVADAIDTKGTRGDAVLPLQGGMGFRGSVKVELVELPLVVLDTNGRPITGLTAEDFRIIEDDAEVRAEGFGTTADLPLSLALAVDISGSMDTTFPIVRKAVSDFVANLLKAGDEVMLVTFSWDPEIVLRWTDRIDAVSPKLDRVVPDGGTSLLDAVIRSLEQFRGRRGRQALVLLTDGDDTASRSRLRTAERYAHTMRIPIFSIGLNVGGLQFGARGVLKDLSTETGGEAFFPKKADDLPPVYARIDELLRSQYLIWYTSPSDKPVEQFRSVRVELTRIEGEVKTIRGYYPGK